MRFMGLRSVGEHDTQRGKIVFRWLQVDGDQVTHGFPLFPRYVAVGSHLRREPMEAYAGGHDK